MDIQSSLFNQLFALYPVIIQGWVSSVKPAGLADGGIPKSLYDGQPQGLECLVDPWTELQLRSWTMAVDDRVDLYVNDDPTPVTGKTINPGEEQTRVRLYVPHGRLRNGVNRLHYKVIRVGGNSEDSRDLNVLYHLRSPGEPAPQGLDLVIPPDVIKDGVSAARAAQGVEFGFTYSNRRAYDRIRFQLGDESVDWEITDASVPVIKTLFTNTFQQVGDNPNLLLDYVVFDQLGNSNRSSTKQIDVHLGRLNLSAAILREIPTENNDDPNTVDLAKLNGNPLSALIHLVETIWKVGDSIKLAFTAELNGSVVETHEETSSVTQVPSQFVWSIPNNKIIANSIVKVMYQQVRGGAVIATSVPTTAQVIGEGVIKLNPSTLVAPAVNPIIPLQYPNGVTLRIEFLTALPGDKAQLIEINPPASATPFPTVAFNANKRTNTVLSQAFLAARHGKQLTFRWALIRGSKEIARSGPLVLTVNRIVDGDARFPTPVIVGYTGANLDVTKLVAIDKLTIAPWTPLGRFIWLRYEGVNSSGAPIFFDDLNGVPHSDAQGLTRPALVNWLKALKHGSLVTISFLVGYSEGADRSTAVTFPVRKYTVSAVEDVKPVITRIEDSKGVVIPNGTPTVDNIVTLTGAASKGQKVAIFDGPTRKDEATADPTTGIWTKRFTGLSLGGHNFTAKALYGTELVSNAWNFVRNAPLQPPSITGVYANGVRIPPGGSLTTPATVYFTGTCSPGPGANLYLWLNGMQSGLWVATVSTNATVWTSSSIFVQFFAGGQPIPHAVYLLDNRLGGNLRSPTYTFTPIYKR